MSSLDSKEMKALKQLEDRLRLEQQNKAAAKVHLLAMQALLSRNPIVPAKPFT